MSSPGKVTARGVRPIEITTPFPQDLVTVDGSALARCVAQFSCLRTRPFWLKLAVRSLRLGFLLPVPPTHKKGFGRVVRQRLGHVLGQRLGREGKVWQGAARLPTFLPSGLSMERKRGMSVRARETPLLFLTLGGKARWSR